MKRLSALLAMILVLSVCFFANAEKMAEFAVEGTDIEAGKAGEIKVLLTRNPGISGFLGQLDYDHDRLEMIGAETFGFSNMFFAANPENGQFAGLSLGGDSTEEGEAFGFTLKAAEENETVQVIVSVLVAECSDMRKEFVMTTGYSGSVTIYPKEEPVPGDANGDGRVDGRDLLRLARYIAGDQATVNAAASDVNGDGRVDGRDLLRLAKHLAGVEGAELVKAPAEETEIPAASGVQPSANGEPAAQTATMMGDVNLDGVLNGEDGKELLQALIGLKTFSPQAAAQADLNRDGRVDIFDAVYIMNVAAGIEEMKPNEPEETPRPEETEKYDIRLNYDPREIHPGETVEPIVTIIPDRPGIALTYVSSDPAIVSVNEYGCITGVKKGSADITVTAENGASATCRVSVVYDAAQLSFSLLPDGSGYEITGCDSDVYTVNIPASYNGLPVTSIAGRAFINCVHLQSFTADPDQGTFYADGGVLFTNNPVKTLVRFPNDYGVEHSSYLVPEDTVAIAPYAFSGQQKLGFLHLQEGVTTLGSYAFAESNEQILIYVPDSLTSIGTNLLQGQKKNVAFYGNPDSYAAQYAEQYSIPYGGIVPDFDSGKQTAEETSPELQDTDSNETVDPNEVVCVRPNYHAFFIDGLLAKFSLSEYQQQNPSEVRLLLDQRWNLIVPDKNGKTKNGYPAQTGLYGMGYTEGETYLRGYDLNGNVTGVRKVSGHFIYALPGAYNLGVSGGRNTMIGAVPYQPIYISAAGNYPLDASNYYHTPNDTCFQLYIMMFTHANISMFFPDYVNTFAYGVTGIGAYADDYNSPFYSLLTITLKDKNLLEQSDKISVRFDYLQELFKNSEFSCYANASYGLTKEYGEKMYALFQKVKVKMRENYYPQEALISPVAVNVNGKYPASFQCSIDLDEQFIAFDGSEGNSFSKTVFHEMVHAIDQSDYNGIYQNGVGPSYSIVPSPWLEGRAVYLAGQSSEYANVDWSFISQQDREDFFRYYYYSTNSYTMYSVGYYFFKYLCDTYGENISQAIIRNIIQTEAATYNLNYSDEQRAAAFKQCVTSATDPDVFQNFVRDVIEKK